MLDMASHYKVFFLMADKNPLDGFLWIPGRLVSHTWCSWYCRGEWLDVVRIQTE